MGIASPPLGEIPYPMDQDDIRITSVRLTRKYAEKIDGVDLSRNKVGDTLDVSVREARMLIAEGWAAPCERGKAEDENASRQRRRDDVIASESKPAEPGGSTPS
jgi:hypothetical protein